MNRRLLSAVVAFLGISVITSCADHAELTGPAGPSIQTSISDGARGGDPNFFWLAPTVPVTPPRTGPFDAGALNQLTLEVCLLDAAGACTGPVLERFTSTPALNPTTHQPDGLNTITVSPWDQYYVVSWATSRDNLNGDRYYRVRVLRSGVELGSLDVDPVSSEATLAKVNTALYTGVIKNTTLRLLFRIQAPSPRVNVRINEVESNGGTPGDWIELYNSGAAAVSLAGYSVRDNDDTHRYVFPAGTTIPAHGYYVVEEAALGFGLGSADAARLFALEGSAVIDSYSWTAHAATTYGRCPNATGAFATTGLPTKGAANICGGNPALVRFNEVESNGGTPGDWSELINTGPTPVDLSGFVFKDNDDTHHYVLPAGTIIPAGGFYVIEEAAQNFGLGSADAVRLFTPDGLTIIDAYSWTAHAATTYGRCPDGTGAFSTMTSITKGAANDCGVPVKINEVESSGGVPGDWVELINPTPAPVDLSGFVFKDNDDSHSYVIPSGTIIAGNGYLVLEEAAFGFGLGGADAARLFAPGGVTLVDSYTWTVAASTTYGRCPDATGAFATTTAVTKGTSNACPGQSTASPWPGDSTIQIVDGNAVFGGNMSGLVYEGSGSAAPGILWAARNGPGTLHRLVFNGSIWTPDASNGFGSGKLLHYMDGSGNVDAEGVTLTGSGTGAVIYIASERDNNVSGTSHNSVLRYDPSAAGSDLAATNEWNLTADLPVTGANLGMEAVAFLPDAFLTSRGFFDESKGHTYLPSDYANHAGGLFFVALEQNGGIYAYALNHADNSFTRVATIASGFIGVMDLNFDSELNYLWAECDDGCLGRTATLEISSVTGRFVVTHVFDRPAQMPNLNNEGFAITPQAECVANRKPVFWSDDAETGGHALRRGTVSCSPLGPSPAPAFAMRR